jgi:hypothetical protein
MMFNPMAGILEGNSTGIDSILTNGGGGGGGYGESGDATNASGGGWMWS